MSGNPNSAAPAVAANTSQERNPWLVLAVLAGAIFMLLLDTTIVNVAQVKIREGLNADLSEIQWILDSYLLAFAVLLLTFGRLGDVFGRKRLFILGMGDLRCRVGTERRIRLGRRRHRYRRRKHADRLPHPAGRRRRIHDAANALAHHRRLPA